MRDLIGQLKERRIWRVLIIYPSMAFVLLQAIEFFINNYDLDTRYLTAGIVFAIVLLPAAFIWNWRHGEVGEQAFARSEIGAYVLSAVAAVVAVGWYWTTTPEQLRGAPQTPATARSIAVMPFENISADAGVQYLCDGIAESLINWLSTVPDIKVSSRTASFRMRDETQYLQQLADALGVDSVLRGRLESVGDQVVVSASLVSTTDESQIWGERLTVPAGDILTLERTIVLAIKSGLGMELSEGEDSVALGGTDNPVAHGHYLRGHYLIQSTNPESIQQGIKELRKAIRADPGFARPYADLADSLTQLITYGHLEGEELLGEARNAAYTAVALAPDLAESHTALAAILMFFEFDWAATDEAFEAAIALGPQSPVPYHRYTDYLVFTLRLDRAREMALGALAVDPLDSSSMHALGFVEMFAGNFDEAVKAFGDWNRYHPESRWSYVKYSTTLALAGECEAAQEVADALVDMTGGKMSALMESWLAWGYKVCGLDERYAESKERIMASREHIPDTQNPGYAYLLAMEGEGEKIADMYERMVAERNPLIMFGQVFLIDYFGWDLGDQLVTDARYQALLDELDFPPNDL